MRTADLLTTSAIICMSFCLLKDATHQQPSGHIFISYQWDSKSAVLRVRDCLRDAGFPIWIDEESMCMLKIPALKTKAANLT